MMKAKSIFVALILMTLVVQTAWSQGFRVYKSDGTVAQFSFRTDSIVFYDSIGSDVDFGPYTPVNQMIVGTWYKSKSKSVTFNEDGTTNFYNDNCTYEFMPYHGSIIFYNTDGAPVNVYVVHKVTAESLIMSQFGDSGDITVWTRTQPSQLVTSIVLSETSVTLRPDEVKTLTATIFPKDADNRAVTWESSNEMVATVSDEGIVIAVAEGTCTITCSATDGTGVKAECSVTVTEVVLCPDDNHPHAIDLGLPSGTKWCCCNVSANVPEGYGGYYAWGETSEKSEYSWESYVFGSDMNKDIGSDISGTSYDVAYVCMGAPWHMPSTEQQQELIINCSRQWTQQNGVNGILVTGPNGGHIFLPATLYRYYDELYSTGGYSYYWSSSVSTENDNNACFMCFHSGYWSWDYGAARYIGQSVRAVCP